MRYRVIYHVCTNIRPLILLSARRQKYNNARVSSTYLWGPLWDRFFCLCFLFFFSFLNVCCRLLSMLLNSHNCWDTKKNLRRIKCLAWITMTIIRKCATITKYFIKILERKTPVLLERAFATRMIFPFEFGYDFDKSSIYI